MKRRAFIKNSGIVAAGAGFTRLSPVAGPFTIKDLLTDGIPADKKLSRAWLNSLYERGTVTTYKKTADELKYIGMPVGGINCGSVYLGGDGRLWLWDIFNKNQLGVVTKTLPVSLEGFNAKEINNIHGSLYLEPLTDIFPFQQGFAVSINDSTSVVTKRLHHDYWEEISFEATYPVATIRYSGKDVPVEVELKAFSPFIPGDEINSGLPATIQSISVKNLTKRNLDIEIFGWLENRTLPETGKTVKDFKRTNRLIKSANCKCVLLDCETENDANKKTADFGNLALAGISNNMRVFGSLQDGGDFTKIKDFVNEDSGNPVAVIHNSSNIKGLKSFTADFVISWHVPNLSFKEIPDKGRYYEKQFKDAAEVATYIAGKFRYLKSKTVLWHKTWYDSSLPWWFMERTFLNTSILATTTCHRMASGRFYAWEGVGCCAGNCLHVWQYAQAAGRIFPALEKDERTRIDLGIALRDDGGISFRAEADKRPAIDGQAGTILRFLREHQMSKDSTWLQANWDKIKRTIQFLISQDKNKDGMEDTPLENTLDAVWRGEIAWIVGLSIAGVRAGQALAEEMNDNVLTEECKQYVEKGKHNMETQLFNGEYFIHRADPAVGKKEIGSYNTCHIDQVYGQSWAWQVGLERVLDKEKTMSALRSLWKYNYMPDVGPYIKNHPGGRFYALAGEGGMVMNTNPKQEDKPYGEAKAWQIGYFSECMSGFEHQVAAHMMAEGMVEEALVLTRSVHDRYHAHKRNPFNEIECSDHYARAMASYGTFISACGFTYHGPKGHIGFNPRISPEKFKAPFTVAEGWGTYTQEKHDNRQVHTFSMRYGSVKLRQISLFKLDDQTVKKVVAISGKQKIPVTFSQEQKQVIVNLGTLRKLQVNQVLSITICHQV